MKAFVGFLLVTILVLSGCDGGSKSSSSSGSGTATKNGGDTPTKNGGDDKAPPPPPVKARELSSINSPWRTAKVGDWAEFAPHFGQPGVFRHEVIEIRANEIVFKIVNVTTGKSVNDSIPLSFEDAEKSYNPPEKLVPKPSKIEEVEIDVGGKKLKCVYYVREALGGKTETWLCNDFPLNGGVVKSIKDGNLNLDIKAFNKVE